MEEESPTLNGFCSNFGPSTKEILLRKAEDEYCNGNVLQSIFYQSCSLYQSVQDRYNQNAANADATSNRARNAVPIETLMKEMNSKEIEEFSNNALIQYVCKSLKNMEKKTNLSHLQQLENCNFLRDVQSPLQGITKIEQICQQLPEEWTILQLCKGPRTETTYSIFSKIHESDGAIYLSLMKHARSNIYPKPLCLRFAHPEQGDLYKDFGNIVNRFKECVKITGNTSEEKKLYWSLLNELNGFIANACADLNNFFYPWTFLFTGISNSSSQTSIIRERWSKIDEFCDKYEWQDDTKILLSLAASSVDQMCKLQIDAICELLTDNRKQKKLASNLLEQMISPTDDVPKNNTQHYPCILIVDERLDHFFWEEINVEQEFSRVNSLQCLWRLYSNYKSDIRRGYLNVNITDGGCLLNPDKNLQKMESRMRSFFEYWIPHWNMLIGQRPTADELFGNYFNHSCYVYAGHGSGLQYINGRNITKNRLNCVVFLFGCDSSRLHSSGLFSELVGPHLYYQAAMCPALVGTLMPGLDCNMDKIATDILSRWIAPKSSKVLPWNEIEENTWAKEFIIKPKTTAGQASPPPSMDSTPHYNIGSLCAILAKVHQRVRETKLYNTVPYVCRGLPVWNCNVEKLS